MNENYGAFGVLITTRMTGQGGFIPPLFFMAPPTKKRKIIISTALCGFRKRGAAQFWANFLHLNLNWND